MARLIVLAVALIAAVISLEVALYIARYLGPLLHAHMSAGWVVLACNVLIAAALGIFALRRKKTVVKEDEPLT